MHDSGARGQEQEAEGPQRLGSSDEAEAAQGALAHLDLAELQHRHRADSAFRVRFRTVRSRLGLGLGLRLGLGLGLRLSVIRFQVVAEADTRLEGKRTEKQEGDVSVPLVTFWGHVIPCRVCVGGHPVLCRILSTINIISKYIF